MSHNLYIALHCGFRILRYCASSPTWLSFYALIGLPKRRLRSMTLPRTQSLQSHTCCWRRVNLPKLLDLCTSSSCSDVPKETVAGNILMLLCLCMLYVSLLQCYCRYIPVFHYFPNHHYNCKNLEVSSRVHSTHQAASQMYKSFLHHWCVYIRMYMYMYVHTPCVYKLD